MNQKVLELAEIKSSAAKVAEIYNLKKITLFGSYALGKETNSSDIDLLVDFGPRPTSIYKIAGVKLKMEELTGKDVDVVALPIPNGSILEIDREVLLYEQQGL